MMERPPSSRPLKSRDDGATNMEPWGCAERTGTDPDIWRKAFCRFALLLLSRNSWSGNTPTFQYSSTPWDRSDRRSLPAASRVSCLASGGAGGIRTHNPRVKGPLLRPLSYSPGKQNAPEPQGRGHGQDQRTLPRNRQTHARLRLAASIAAFRFSECREAVHCHVIVLSWYRARRFELRSYVNGVWVRKQQGSPKCLTSRCFGLSF